MLCVRTNFTAVKVWTMMMTNLPDWNAVMSLCEIHPTRQVLECALVEILMLQKGDKDVQVVVNALG